MEEAEAQRGAPKRMSRHQEKDRSFVRPRSPRANLNSNGPYIIFFLFLCVLLPPIINFIYSVIRDPLTPTLLKDGYLLLKEKSMSFLSKSEKKKRKKRGMD